MVHRDHFKNKFKMTLFALLIILASSGNAQMYKGVLITEHKGTPVEYANVGIVGKNIGTASNLHGQFELRIPTEHLRDSIRLSVIGYETITFLISDFINRSNDTIFMKEKSYDIAEVVITPYTEIKFLGNRRKGLAAFFLTGSNENRGMEIGIILDPNDSKVFLKSLTLNDVMIDFTFDNGKTYVEGKEVRDTMLFRLNLYNVTSKNEFENIMTQPVFIKWNTDNFEQLKKIDISEHNLVIENKVLLTLEFFDDVSARSIIRFNGSFFGPNSYIRSTSQGNWKKQSNSVGIFVEAIMMK